MQKKIVFALVFSLVLAGSSALFGASKASADPGSFPPGTCTATDSNFQTVVVPCGNFDTPIPSPTPSVGNQYVPTTGPSQPSDCSQINVSFINSAGIVMPDQDATIAAQTVCYLSQQSLSSGGGGSSGYDSDYCDPNSGKCEGNDQ